ncbi:vesicle coat protein [Xylariaceae sp. FL0594]|nr:vesicle coat protein [Xylariaceae sp. FL0594]
MAMIDTSALLMLTTDIQLCLAHYCDLHGPTPLMVTEGLPVPCGRCLDEDAAEAARVRPGATAGGAPAVTDGLRQMNLGASRSASTPASDQEAAQTQRSAILRASQRAPNPVSKPPPTIGGSAAQTPPQSPRRAPTSPHATSTANGSRRDSSFQRTYDEYVTKRANPCANCALTLPKLQEGRKRDPKAEAQGPTLRTRAPYARVYGSLADASPPSSSPQSTSTSDAEEETSNGSSSTGSRPRPATSASQSSLTSRCTMPYHTHYLDYTSTHEPTAPSTYSIVRASCLRTLSFETLPRRPEATQSTPALPSPTTYAMPPFPSALGMGPGYITAPPTPQSASSGGPIFFGDPSAGYTTAYIFRIPDIHARGRKRVYAFLALSTHRERLAMKAFSFISTAFRDLAAWIQDLAEEQAERDREREEAGSAVAALNAAYCNGGLGSRGPHDSGIGLGGDRERETSSFLTGGRRSAYMQRMGGSMGPGGFTPKARGLAELVGLPDFFLELHTRFVQVLLELAVVLGS